MQIRHDHNSRTRERMMKGLFLHPTPHNGEKENHSSLGSLCLLVPFPL
jgi:hypothetical protein